MASAAFEYDAKPGEMRDAVAAMFLEWRRFLAESAREAQKADLDPSLDPEALASEIVSLYLGQHLEHWLLGEADAGERALSRLEALIGVEDGGG